MSADHIQELLASSESEDQAPNSPPEKENSNTQMEPDSITPINMPVDPEPNPIESKQGHHTMASDVLKKLQASVQLPSFFYIGLTKVTKTVVDQLVPAKKVDLEFTQDNILSHRRKYDKEFAKLIPEKSTSSMASLFSSPFVTIPSLLMEDIEWEEYDAEEASDYEDTDSELEANDEKQEDENEFLDEEEREHYTQVQEEIIED